MDRFNPNLFNEVAELGLRGIEQAWIAAGLKKMDRTYIGMGPVPAEDCCPDLVGWITNLRLWDSNAPDTLQEGYVLPLWGIAFDLNIRIGLCYLESDSDGGALDSREIQGQAEIINRYGLVGYLGLIQSLLSSDCQNAAGNCDINVSPSSMFPYNLGGCAGWNITVAISVV